MDFLRSRQYYKKIIDLVQNIYPVMQALLATRFIWAVTALGAATVFMAKDMSL